MTTFACWATSMVANTSCPTKRRPAGRVRAARTSTLPFAVSITAPMPVTTPSPSAAPPAARPTLRCTGWRGWMRPAWSGGTERWISSPLGSTTCTSVVAGSACAFSRAFTAETMPEMGERITAWLAVLRAAMAAAFASASAAAAVSASLRGRMPASASRRARSYACCAVTRATSVFRTSAANTVWSSATSGCPRPTACPVET